MSNGMDKFPGHAYAPGMEPKHGWLDFLDLIGLGTSDGLLSLPTIALASIAFMMFLSRALGITGRPRSVQRFTRRSTPHGRVALASGPDMTRVIAHTLADRNFDRASGKPAKEDPDADGD